ncbi:KICSTOR complex protein ITFG2 [Frankliniella fusca]|uniref:KICSTOR complex protein ITFG2 n=1 Tax=Frankliniella fusca TaxID=407009 RepID=A0AAE1H9T1_9NEOP|nr:KICSTOR complex protein ITFG2 [Frankliniella fusca]
MRAVCFVNRLEFEFGGNVFRSSLTLGDVDNTGEMALVAGNASGDLAVFKGDKQWQILNGLGMITAVGIGDVLNCGLNAVVVVCGDGWCHIYLCPPGCARLECVHVQRIPANTKVLLLGDIDADGQQELVLGLTDRVVRSYRWCWLGEPIGKEFVQSLGKTTNVASLAGRGALVCLNKWEFAHQLGAVTLNHNAKDKPSLLVAQPGGTFMKIRCYPESDVTADFMDSDSSGRSNQFGETSVVYHPLCINSMRNPNVSTEILGDIETGHNNDKGSPFAVATLDGTLMLVHNDEILWSYQVDHQLFAVTKLDITGDGHDEIVVCSWDGQTYILDLEKHCVRFQLEETVSGFCSGKYTLEPNCSKPPIPVLVYATFNNKIYIYYDIHLPSMLTENFNPRLQSFMQGLNFDEVRKKLSASEGKDKILAELLTPPLTREKVKQLTEISLYFRKTIPHKKALTPSEN